MKAKTRQMSSELFSRGWLVVDPRIVRSGGGVEPLWDGVLRGRV